MKKRNRQKPATTAPSRDDPARRRASPLVYIRLTFPTPSSMHVTPADSWLLPGLSVYKALEIFARGEENVRDPAHGTAFGELRPTDKDTFQLELAAVLPDRLPNINSRTEYSVDLVDGTEHFRLWFSNQMCRLLFRSRGESYEALAPHSVLPAMSQIPDTPAELLAAPPDPLPTVATCRFSIHGASAEEALESGLYPSAERFVRLLNRVVSANIALQIDASPAIVAEYEINTFPTMLFALKGLDPARIVCSKFATNLYRAILNPRDISGIDAARLLELAQGSASVSDITLLLHSARSLLAGGMVRQALLQLAIACETATRRYVHTALVAAGTSKTKVKAAEKDLTFNIMLNVLLFSLAPPAMKPDRDLVGDIDQVRDLRNTLMHEGTLPASRHRVESLYKSGVRFVKYLREAAESQELEAL